MNKDRDNLIKCMAIARNKVEDLRNTLLDVEDQLYAMESAYLRILGEDEPVDLFFQGLSDRVLNWDDDFDDPDESYEDLLERDDVEFEKYWSAYYRESCYCDWCDRYRKITALDYSPTACNCPGCRANRKPAPDYRMD